MNVLPTLKPGFATVAQAAIAASVFLFEPTIFARPRPPGPPLPETGVMYRERFNQPLGWPTNQMIDPSTWGESWSGYALNRQQAVTSPWVISMVASNGTYRMDPQRGALRLWYLPNWGSASTGLGRGPGNMARLLTLVSTNGGASATWWSLVISENGNEVHLVCQAENGPAVCLSGAIAFQSGTWHCLALGYTGTNSALFVDGQQLATGNGLVAVPAEVAPSTSLVIGSSLSGTELAAGQIEEFTAFTARRRLQEVLGQCFGLNVDREIEAYYSNTIKTAALGPITPAEEQALADRAAASRMTAQQPATLQGGYALEPDPSWCGTNSICDVWLTNVWAGPNSEGGWNTMLSIGGGTNGVLYDVFCTTNLAGGAFTNLVWAWVAQGYACDTLTLTNQPDATAFYILGTPVDSDGDGLTDAYELLISHTDPHRWDSDGDGLSDGWEVAHGMNPNLDESEQTAGRLNYQYDGAGWLRAVTGAGGESITLDAEGNVQQVQ